MTKLTSDRVASLPFLMVQTLFAECQDFLCIIPLKQNLPWVVTVASGTVKVYSTCTKIHHHKDMPKDFLTHSTYSQCKRPRPGEVMTAAHFQVPQEASGRPSSRLLKLSLRRWHASHHRIPLEPNPTGLLTHMIIADQRGCTQVFLKCPTKCLLQDQM
jgi:hypothetical protein